MAKGARAAVRVGAAWAAVGRVVVGRGARVEKGAAVKVVEETVVAGMVVGGGRGAAVKAAED